MRIVQTVFGAFHHFELARELHRRQHLQAIYSTWPWARLKREGLPREFVRTFPYIHFPEMLLRRAGVRSTWLYDQTGYTNALAFDAWTDPQLHKTPAPDALIAISGSSLKTGRRLQQDGTVFICDRGSSHQRYQEELVSSEFARWGVSQPVSDIRDTIREEAIYETCNLITVASTFSANSFIKKGISPHKIKIISLGVRLEDFTVLKDPAPIPERIEILFAGQIGLRKGVPYLLDAFSRLQHPRKRLRFAGTITSDLLPILSRFPQENVEFLGNLPKQQLATLMNEAHLLVLPSVEEGFGMVMAQAMACGCPVLATTNTGAPDLYTNEMEGFIVPIRDSNALLERMQRIADEPGLHERMREASLLRVKSIGGWHQYGDQWEALLKEITAAKVQA